MPNVCIEVRCLREESASENYNYTNSLPKPGLGSFLNLPKRLGGFHHGCVRTLPEDEQEEDETGQGMAA